MRRGRRRAGSWIDTLVLVLFLIFAAFTTTFISLYSGLFKASVQ